LAFPLQVNMQDAIHKFDPSISDESIPAGDQALVLFRRVRPFEIFVYHRGNRIGGGGDIPRDRSFKGRRIGLKF